MTNPQSPVYQNTALLIAAGGSSSRFGTGQNKLLLPLDGTPIICHALRNLLPVINPALAYIMAPAGSHDEFRNALDQGGIPKAVKIVGGGATRQQSVLNGLRALPVNVKWVAIQDGARPFTSATLLSACLESTFRHGSGIAAHKVTDTVKIAAPDGKVISTPDRDTLWATETPQVFALDLILPAYERAEKEGWQTTDDAQVAELAGCKVYLVPHQENNRKITYARDLDDNGLV